MKSHGLREVLQDYIKGNAHHQPKDVNHWVRRFYRCYIDGSYLGYEDYKDRIRRLEGIVDQSKKRNQIRLRMYAISDFQAFLQHEFGMSTQTIRKVVLDVFGDDIEELNRELMEEQLDLINYR